MMGSPFSLAKSENTLMSSTNSFLKLGSSSGGPGLLKPNEAVKQFFTDSIIPVIQHLGKILPDAVFVFLVIFSILTQNFANGVLAISLIESTLAFSIIGNAADYFSTAPAATTNRSACEAGFPTQTYSYSTLSIFSGLIGKSAAFPSHSIAVISTLVGYLLTALFQYRNELKQLGPKYEMRIPIGVTLSFLTLTAFVLFRYIAGCENLGTIIGTLLIGILFGTAIVYQNVALLGKESVNLLGIPTLESRTLAGKPLYVCKKTE